MKKLIIAAAITTLFSTMAIADSGLADRINEARSYPNKTVSTRNTQMPYMQEKQNHRDMSTSQVIRGELRDINYKQNDSDDPSSDYTDS